MEKINLILKLSFKFSQKYIFDYLINVLKYVFIAILGSIPLMLCFIDPLWAVIALIVTIPCLCFSFWKGFFVTYALNLAAFDFIKTKRKADFSYFIAKAQMDEKQFIKYVSFCAILMVLGYLPTVYYALNSDIKLSLDMSAYKGIITASIINTIFLTPFLNFFTQSFYFSENKKNFIKMVFDCYSKLDILGLIIAQFIVLAITYFSSLNIISYLIFALPLNVLIYSINTFWFYGATQKRK